MGKLNGNEHYKEARAKIIHLEGKVKKMEHNTPSFTVFGFSTAEPLASEEEREEEKKAQLHLVPPYA